MNWLDITVFVTIALFTFGGLKNGIIRTIVSFAGLMLGITFAGQYYSTLAPQLTFITDANVANIAAFIGILVGVLIASAVAAWALTHFVKAILLGWLNQLLGGAFGFLMGVVTTSALLAMWVKFRGPGDFITESAYAGAILGYFPFILSFLPTEFASIKEFFQ